RYAISTRGTRRSMSPLVSGCTSSREPECMSGSPLTDADPASRVSSMRVTVCELPHETRALDTAWASLCAHTIANASQLVLPPEFAMVDPVWESDQVDVARWFEVETLACVQLRRLPELCADYVVGTRPVRVNGRRLNQGFLWSAASGIEPLRSKWFMPEEA